MESQNSYSNMSIDSQIPYSKIIAKEDSFLEIKETDSNRLYTSQINSNVNEINNDNDNINNDSSNNNKENKRQRQGILNRKFSSYLYMKIGNTFTFFGNKDGSPLIVIGPHWPMYLCFNSFVCSCFICFFYFFWNNMNIFIKYLGIITFLMFSISYTLTFLVNPGIPKYDENAVMGQPREKYKFCEYCKIWINIEENTSHCFDCNVCVEGYDHHCPWTGKCIGKKNLKFFYVFLTSILFAVGFFVISLTEVQNKMLNEKKKKKWRKI